MTDEEKAVAILRTMSGTQRYRVPLKKTAGATGLALQSKEVYAASEQEAIETAVRTAGRWHEYDSSRRVARVRAPWSDGSFIDGRMHSTMEIAKAYAKKGTNAQQETKVFMRIVKIGGAQFTCYVTVTRSRYQLKASRLARIKAGHG